jgi:hypothetical protein
VEVGGEVLVFSFSLLSTSERVLQLCKGDMSFYEPQNKLGYMYMSYVEVGGEAGERDVVAVEVGVESVVDVGHVVLDVDLICYIHGQVYIQIRYSNR